MPRPSKCRKVCCLPKTKGFNPLSLDHSVAPVLLTIDEYEAIRLIDNENLSQEECSVKMEVARTTVQQIYTNARKKIAQALVEGKPLRIRGGNYKLCNGDPIPNGCPCCHKVKKARSESGDVL